jgi:hypothetical protein
MKRTRRRGIRSKLTRNFEEKRNLASCLLVKEVAPDDHKKEGK